MSRISTRFFASRRWRGLSILLSFVGVIAFASEYAMSHAGGMTGQTNKVNDGQGCTCHCATANNATTVTLQTSATTFEAGQTYTFTISVSNANEVKAGCDVAVQNGSLAAGNDGLQLVGSQLTHSAPVNLPATWTFTYTAPSTAGVDTIFAVGNAVNNDGGNGFGNCTDKWNFASKYIINVTAPFRTLNVTRNTIAFGNRRVGGTYTDTLHLNSVGNTAVSITSQSMKNGASLSNSPTGSTTLSVGSSELETITFSPSARGALSDSFIVISDANNNTLANPGNQGTAITGTGIQASFKGQTTNPPNTLSFGNIRVGPNGNASLSYSIQNDGDDTLFLTTPSLSGTGSGAYVITTVPTLTLPPGVSTSMTVKFTPGAKQTYSASINMTAANGVSNVPTINLFGTGTGSILTVQSFTDIGTGPVGGSRGGSIAISNGGDADLNISSIVIGNQFQGSKFVASGGSSFNIAPSGTGIYGVTYSPTSERIDTAILTINCDDITTPTKQITIVGEGGIARMAQVTIDTVKFGDVRVGSSALSYSFVVKNIGSYDLSLLGVDVSPSQFTLSSKPLTVAPGASASIVLQFTPSGAGPATGMAIVRADDSNNPSDTVYLLGNGTVSNFDIPSGVTFGDLKLNTSKDDTLKLKNLGTAPVKILKYSLTDPSNGFVLLDTALHLIAAHDSGTIRLRFNAFKEQAYTGAISITTDESGSSTRQIQLSGRGVNSKLNLSVTTLDFGNVDSAKSLTKTFTITNTGTATAVINSLSITGSSAFSVDSPKTAFSIPSNGTSLVSISFSPVAAGHANATLTVGAADGTQPQVPLSGTGIGKKDTTQSGSVRATSQVLSLIEITPNPASGSATLKIGVASDLEDVSLNFFDVGGKLLRTQYVGGLGQGVQRIPLVLPQTSGLSFVRIVSAGRMIGSATIVITR